MGEHCIADCSRLCSSATTVMHRGADRSHGRDAMGKPTDEGAASEWLVAPVHAAWPPVCT